ncbi:DNA-binding response regulator, NarL/FixJ family, contains REC and HTH domains [Dyadobacter soli]|uniref:DNA-binding response regulator, NarL/FixJ family, contains REC and HTH domains n=1 Tax=Dyadobacter soli TaxID=659014 RepID=A0A1G7NBH6_9BACT|nr:response regulator transcription factor [Dyadobacter soli]SDF71393.1 DNA-binding response regulator, NarL/FixJ family, contains REC and HTH domains [Dyadobacter soli]
MNILIIDCFPFIRTGFRALLDENFPGHTLYEAATLEDALQLMSPAKFKLVISDISGSGGLCAGLIDSIRNKQKDVPILIYSNVSEHLYAVPLMRSGANGFICKRAPLDELTRAVHAVLSGSKYLNVGLQAQLLAASDNSIFNPIEKLSPRESMIMNLIIEGKSTKTIATILDLKCNTISTYKKRLFGKMDVDGQIQLAQKALMLTKIGNSETHAVKYAS